MENFFSRYRNETVLVAILFVQLIALATQVRVPSATQGSNTAEQGTSQRLIRVWALSTVSPFQKMFVHGGVGVHEIWRNYIYLRDVRKENDQLQQQLNQLRLEQTRMRQDAEQGQRLQGLLGFREQFIGRTMAAQVIGSSGTDLSKVIYIDRGARDGVQAGMAVITPDGIVGKISRADKTTSQVLLITDPSSGAGVIMERLRLNGVLKGSTTGFPEIQNVMADEKIQVGERIITTGGDRVFPKGLAVGTVESVAPDRERDPFLAIKVRPAVDLGRLEEVLLVTELGERNMPSPQDANQTGPLRAADMLAERLPSFKKKTTEEQKADEKKLSAADATAERGAAIAAIPDPGGKPVSQSGATANPSTNAAGAASPRTERPANPPRDVPR